MFDESQGFDLSDPKQRRHKRYESPIPANTPEVAEVPATDGKFTQNLDSAPNHEIWQQLIDAYSTELDRQEKNRAEMGVDEDFYDNIQWNEEDANTLRQRGQIPISYNVIATTVNWVLGTEKRGRSDFRILPRRKEDGQSATRKSEFLKYLSDVNRTPFHRSRAFADAVKVGLGWLEDGIWDDLDGEDQYSRYESWRNMLYDSTATELDLSDARYLFRSKWVDVDVAKHLAPSRATLIDEAANDGDRYFLSDDFGDVPMDFAELEREQAGSPSRSPNRYQRRRLRVIEAWFKKPEPEGTVDRFRDGPFKGELFDPWSPGHQHAKAKGARLIAKPLMRVYVALLTVKGLLWLSPSPYRHNRYPFTPIWGNRRGRDGLPYGLIRGLRGMQEDINKRASKALHIMSTVRSFLEENAVEDIDEFTDEVARPDAVIVYKAGKKPDVETDRADLQYHMEWMSRTLALLQSSAGVTDENLGRETNAKAGIAIQRRQEQGALTTTHYFDNLRFAYQVQGEKQLANMEQFQSEEKQFRITNDRGTPQFGVINDGLPENDIVRSKADYVISEGDWRASMREAAAAELIGLLEKIAPVAPQLAVVVLDLVVENMDVANRDEIVKRIRAMTGQRDPDADEPTQEELARQQAEAEKEEIARATAIAQLRKIVADAVKSEVQADDLIAKIVGTKVSTQKSAVDTAREIMMTPGVAPAADQILREAGNRSAGEEEAVAAGAAARLPAPQGAPLGA